MSERQDLMSVAKLYRLAKRTYGLLPQYFSRGGHAFPTLHYYLEVTRRCNLRCAMCQYVHWLKDTPVAVQRQGELTTEEWLHVIDQIRRYSLITFTGGEPFIRDDFPQLLERASARTRTHVITNAVLLTEERARECVALAPRRLGGVGFNFTGVSIEGPAEVHDGIRKMRGAFESSTNGIRALIGFRKQAGKRCPFVHITTVIQEANVDTLPEMPRICADLGVDILNFTLEARNWETEGMGFAEPASYVLSAMEFPHIESKRLARALAQTRIAARDARIELRMPDMSDDDIINYYNGKMELRQFQCAGLWTTLFVGAKGDVFPCWIKKVGNVREQSLREIWNGPDLRAFRLRTKERLYGPCFGCCFLMRRGGKQTSGG